VDKSNQLPTLISLLTNKKEFFMKNALKTAGTIAIIMALVFTFTACGNGTTGGGSVHETLNSESYSWADGNDSYVLEITQSGRAVTNGNYTLTHFDPDGNDNVLSTGTASGTASNITLTPKNGSPFTIEMTAAEVTVTGTSDIKSGQRPVTVVSNAPINYGVQDKNKAEVQTADFSYRYKDGAHLCSVINAAEVKVNGGKLSISFGTPKPNFMYKVDYIKGPDITFSASDVMAQSLNQPMTKSRKYFIVGTNYNVAENCGIEYTYVDKDITINGSRTDSFTTGAGINATRTDIYENITLTKGWNYVFMYETVLEYTSTTFRATYTYKKAFPLSTTLPNHSWIVYEYDFRWDNL
jgi:hypothetical protein